MTTTPRTAQHLRDAAQTIRDAAQPLSDAMARGTRLQTEALADMAQALLGRGFNSPAIALAVADLLDSEAYRAEQLRSTPHTPARLADLILADQA